MDTNGIQIVVDFEIDAETVFLIIKNTGGSPAFRLKIKPSSPILGLEGKKDVGELSIFKGISYLAPSKEIKIFLDSNASFFRHLKKTSIRFKISFRDEQGKSFKREIKHDLKIYADLIYFIKNMSHD
jgi:hypothetical protein